MSDATDFLDGLLSMVSDEIEQEYLGSTALPTRGCGRIDSLGITFSKHTKKSIFESFTSNFGL